MKIPLLTALLLSSAGAAHSAELPISTIQASRILINSPAAVEQLRRNHTDSLLSMSTAEIKQGVTRYTLTFNRNCECIPARAIVTITEDLTPTYHDGAPIYDSTVEIKEGN